MPPVISFRIEGLQDLQRKLAELPPRAAKRAIRTGTLAAATIWQREMEARVRTGLHHFGRRIGSAASEMFAVIQRNILVNVRVTDGGLSATAGVGPAKTIAGSKYRLFWAVFLEFGRRAGRSKRGRNYPAMPAYPFIRPAFEARKADVLEEFIIETKNALNQEGLKLT